MKKIKKRKNQLSEALSKLKAKKEGLLTGKTEEQKQKTEEANRKLAEQAKKMVLAAKRFGIRYDQFITDESQRPSVEDLKQVTLDENEIKYIEEDPNGEYIDKKTAGILESLNHFDRYKKLLVVDAVAKTYGEKGIKIALIISGIMGILIWMANRKNKGGEGGDGVI